MGSVCKRARSRWPGPALSPQRPPWDGARSFAAHTRVGWSSTGGDPCPGMASFPRPGRCSPRSLWGRTGNGGSPGVVPCCGCSRRAFPGRLSGEAGPGAHLEPCPQPPASPVSPPSGRAGGEGFAAVALYSAALPHGGLSLRPRDPPRFVLFCGKGRCG